MIKTNLVGNRYERLLVIEPTDSGNNRTRWICKCNCGKIIICTTVSLLRGKKKSCGCLRDEKFGRNVAKNIDTSLPEGVAAFNTLFGIYARNSALRNFTFELSREQFKELTKKDCYYCGQKPAQYFDNSGLCKSSYLYNGIDRIDNTVGYIYKNCVACCKDCNSMKSKKDAFEFIEKCKRIVEYHNYKKSTEMVDLVEIPVTV